MLTQETIDAAVKNLFNEIKFTDKPIGLYDPLRYMIKIGGKRIRPTLCLTAYSLYKNELTPEILEPAAGIEVFHSFTLIHDDIMDKSPLRRGVDTVWKKWDPDTAILSGDVMCIDSYARIAKAPQAVVRDVLDLFTKTSAEVCEGQQYDMDFERIQTVPMEDYMSMIGLKTSVLIACAAKMGAIIAGAPELDCNCLYNYGYNLGLAFQVADDYLDAFGDVKVFGKPIGGDILNGKKSWLTVRAFEKADETLKSRLLDAMSMKAETEEEKSTKIGRVKDIYNTLKVSEDAQKEIIELTEKALGCVTDLYEEERLQVLRNFADILIGRTK